MTEIVTRRNDGGTNAFGIYVDYIVYSKTTKNLLRQERFFLAQNMLCKYVRQAGNKRAAWRSFPLPSHDEARKLLIRNLNRYNKDDAMFGVEMLHEPVLVELATTDIEAIKKSEPPYARFDGTRVVEKHVGKIDDATWAPKETPF